MAAKAAAERAASTEERETMRAALEDARVRVAALEASASAFDARGDEERHASAMESRALAARVSKLCSELETARVERDGATKALESAKEERESAVGALKLEI